MTLSKVAKFLILWLLCQQAGVIFASSAFFTFNEETANESMAQELCHEKNLTIKSSNMDHHHSAIVENDVTLSESDCCNVDCQCSLNGCSSILAALSDKAFNFSTISSRTTRHTPFFPSIPVLSLFRPPIAI